MQGAGYEKRGRRPNEADQHAALPRVWPQEGDAHILIAASFAFPPGHEIKTLPQRRRLLTTTCCENSRRDPAALPLKIAVVGCEPQPWTEPPVFSNENTNHCVNSCLGAATSMIAVMGMRKSLAATQKPKIMPGRAKTGQLSVVV